MRPVQMHEIFNLAIDTLTCLWGGLLAPKLCREELEKSLAPYPFLLSLSSSFSEDTHLSKANYFAISSSDKRLTDVGNNACCMVALFAFENLKLQTNYKTLSKNNTVVFLRHLRNASAHGNRFNFYCDRARKRFLDPGTVRWRNKAITKSLQDKPAFPDFFSVGDFAYLFEDISALIK